jgi:hypothetical protein
VRDAPRLSGDPVVRRLAIPSRVPETLCLLQCIGTSIDVFQAIDERPHEPEKRIRPVRAQFGGLPECRDGVGELALRLGRPVSCLIRVAIDPVQVAIAVPQRSSELPIGRFRRQGMRERFASHPPLGLPDGSSGIR